MTRWRTIHDLPTPALLLDWPAARHNILAATHLVRGKTARLRPHFKSHKCVPLAKEQLAAGNCCGITAATLDEAAALVDGGVNDVLLANQLIGAQKLSRLVELSKRTTVRACVDSSDNASAMSAEAIRQGARVGVLAEIKIAPKRWGLPPGDEAVAFVRQIAALPGLRFDGLQAYYGGLAHLHDAAERDECALRSMELAVDTRHRIEAAGIACPILSGAGTGTFWAVLDLPGVTELQLGSYVLMDWDFQTRTGDRFQIALSVLATVISASGDEFVLDVGVKGLGNKLGPPRLLGQQGYEVLRYAAEEHTVVGLPGHRLKVGDRLRVLPSHAGCTAHLYRQFVVHEGNSVRDLWPISATGYDLTTAEAP